MDSGGVSRQRYVAVAVGCWLFALQWHFNVTSTALPRHCHGTSMALPRQTKIVLVLLSAPLERVSDFRIRDCFLLNLNLTYFRMSDET